MAAPFSTLPEAARWFRAWLTDAALPLWGGAGVDHAHGRPRRLAPLLRLACRDMGPARDRNRPNHRRLRLFGRDSRRRAAKARLAHQRPHLRHPRGGVRAGRQGRARLRKADAI